MSVLRKLVPTRFHAPIRKAKLRTAMARYGHFPYFNHEIYAPTRSVIFERIVHEGAFEPEILLAMRTLAAPRTHVLDIGANIGVMSVALLQMRDDVTVVSIECSPSTLSFLRKTHAASAHKVRWNIFDNAVGKEAGELPFFTAGSANGAYDGLNDTGRGGPTTKVLVQVKTIDQIWEELSGPQVSLIKIDIEGGEYNAILGASQLLAKCRPYILFEWHATNLAAYKRDPQDIFHLRQDGYELFTLPLLQPVTPSLLPLMMAQTEMFLLAPSVPQIVNVKN